MKTHFLKIFYSALLWTVGVVIETYTIDLINANDDLLAVIGLVISFSVVMLMVYGLIKIWSNPQKPK